VGELAEPLCSNHDTPDPVCGQPKRHFEMRAPNDLSALFKSNFAFIWGSANDIRDFHNDAHNL
jgi:hypothetical protein